MSAPFAPQVSLGESGGQRSGGLGREDHLEVRAGNVDRRSQARGLFRRQPLLALDRRVLVAGSGGELEQLGIAIDLGVAGEQGSPRVVLLAAHQYRALGRLQLASALNEVIPGRSRPADAGVKGSLEALRPIERRA